MAQQISLWDLEEKQKPVTVISDSEQDCLLVLEEKANAVIDYMLTNYPKLKLRHKNLFGLDYEIPPYRNSIHIDFLGWEPIENLTGEFDNAIGEVVGMKCVAIISGNTICLGLYYKNHRWRLYE